MAEMQPGAQSEREFYTPEERVERYSAEMDTMIARAKDEDRAFTADESTRFDDLEKLAREAGEEGKAAAEKRAAAEVAAAEQRGRLDALRSQFLPQKNAARASVSEPDIYTKDGKRSYFVDMVQRKNGDMAAAERLDRHAAFQARALNTTPGAIGEVAPPAWMIDQIVKLVRPGRPTADLMKHQEVPTGYSSIHVPRIKTGTQVAPQATQNTAIQVTDMTTDSVQVNFVTLAGGQVISQQLIDQAGRGINVDDLILSDLAADYARAIDAYVLSDATVGLLNQSGAIQVAYTGTQTVISPAFVQGLYSKIAGAIAQMQTKRFATPTHMVMSPARWAGILATFDNSSRPLVVPAPVAYNPVATGVLAGQPQGAVGNWLGLDVVLDASIPSNLGAGTNQDAILIMKADDMVLFESPMQTGVFAETYAQNLSWFVRLYAYAGFLPNRYSSSLAIVTGTQMTAPQF